MCPAHGHNAVMQERLEPAAPRFRVKHSTTEPLHSHFATVTAKAFASVQSGQCLYFPLAAFVISCLAGLSAIEGLQPLGLVHETVLHGLGLA